MELAISKDKLLTLLANQLNNIFLLTSGEKAIIDKYIEVALQRCETNFLASENKYFFALGGQKLQGLILSILYNT